ncbi:unnamed protein product [Diatraea saccharalis]|uniref:Regulatory protein zeste n=1 Tax=Diatraea saccharalis TaxID=40085 RepID=A0A9N9R812_9NEOP|nr:unnamed protein product [Diatraea saccharalis]
MPAQRKVSIRQTEILISFLEANKEFAKGRDSQQGGLLGKVAWERLTKKLNSCGSGTTKSAKEWKIYWNNVKYKVRTKATQIRRRTGGGLAFVGGNLTHEESRILGILGNESFNREESTQNPFPEFKTEEPAASNSQEGRINYILLYSGPPVIQQKFYRAVSDHREQYGTYDAKERNAIKSPVSVPDTDSPSPASGPAAPPPEDVRCIPDIPPWAREVEERHVAAQERTAAALEGMLGVQREMLSILKAKFPI